MFEEKIMRNGKIASLPSDIRDLLSWRMEQGENSGDLLAWLNGHPKVQDSIKNSFDSAPINKQNLSQWRRGGFREWQFHHQFMRAAIHIEDYFEQLTDGVDVPLLAGKMAALLATRYAALLNTWEGAPSPEVEEKLRLLRGVNRDLALLQKTLQQARRLEIDKDQYYEDSMEKSREESRKMALAPWLAMMERNSMEGMLKMYFPPAIAAKIAEDVTAIKFDLPKPKKAPAQQTGQTIADCGLPIADCPQNEPPVQAGSKPVKPSQSEMTASAVNAGTAPSSQAESNPVKPSQTIADCGLQIADCPQNEPPRQAESKPVKPSQSETSGLTVKPEPAEARLKTAA
jgi:hypothetical protein